LLPLAFEVGTWFLTSTSWVRGEEEARNGVPVDLPVWRGVSVVTGVEGGPDEISVHIVQIQNDYRLYPLCSF